ncbi:hypothetical protein IWZ01DRAFT_281787 [Phyllosticta capitalensis]
MKNLIWKRKRQKALVSWLLLTAMGAWLLRIRLGGRKFSSDSAMSAVTRRHSCCKPWRPRYYKDFGVWNFGARAPEKSPSLE